jgi:hypothetical protein
MRYEHRMFLAAEAGVLQSAVAVGEISFCGRNSGQGAIRP